ncbi:hypothetical protein CRP01_19445 [Flavilitoribacter nigricans DSM 23189 = NBRC 102662]|uniref:Uncharacterized protein n=1 Tax=Flavilitoribacter nigricans (strain ATCC 23147 / DSM 23189 / NBRC 102662 / NCIMB 1420 / SS-2) TaxID=1122177 RepID=A0A2D0NA85_FLAN2|nr:hypothetical protein CRP01_19445 [Flavilitoribacter nigricans DSM 23189 = NBRC 102662]
MSLTFNNCTPFWQQTSVKSADAVFREGFPAGKSEELQRLNIFGGDEFAPGGQLVGHLNSYMIITKIEF